jgi:hypothetical protein
MIAASGAIAFLRIPCLPREQRFLNALRRPGGIHACLKPSGLIIELQLTGVVVRVFNFQIDMTRNDMIPKFGKSPKSKTKCD